MGAVFISHSSKDRAASQHLRRWLSKIKIEAVFLDFDPEVGIPVGRTWESELYRRLQHCSATIAYCSNSRSSAYAAARS